MSLMARKSEKYAISSETCRLRDFRFIFGKSFGSSSANEAGEFHFGTRFSRIGTGLSVRR
jgi:hypothetical protein